MSPSDVAAATGASLARGDAMTLGTWLDQRELVPPPALRRRLDAAVSAVPDAAILNFTSISGTRLMQTAIFTAVRFG